MQSFPGTVRKSIQPKKTSPIRTRESTRWSDNQRQRAFAEKKEREQKIADLIRRECEENNLAICNRSMII